MIAETARALKPGGVFLYDTINRTLVSKIVLIKLAQEWRPTRFFQFALHDWNMFIKPEELLTILTRHGLQNREMVGFGATGSPPAMLRAVWLFKRGRANYRDLGEAMASGTVKSLKMSYMGFAIKVRQQEE